MTITFKTLKSVNSNLNDNDVLNIIKEFDENYYNSWLLYNKKINKLTKIDHFIIDLPVIFIDDLIKMLNNKN